MQGKLQRDLGLFYLVLAGVGTIIGAGVYALIGVVAGIAGKASWLAFLVASLLAACTGLSYAELSAHFPDDSAEAAYTRSAFGKHVGFLVGLLTILTGIIASAAVAIGFGGYLTEITGVTSHEGAVFLLLVLTIIAVWGIKETLWVVSILSILQILGLLFISYIGLPQLDITQFTEVSFSNFPAIMAGAALIFFAYLGFEDMVKLAEEAKNPRKNMPRAIIIAIVLTTILYILVILSSLSVVSAEALGGSSAPLALVAGSALGIYASLLVTILALAATASTTLLLMVATSRLIYGMARKQHDLPGFLAWVQPKLGTPVPAILVTTILTLPLLLIGDISLVAQLTNFTIFIVFVLINLSVIVLRYKKPIAEDETLFRVPLAIGKLPIIPLIGGVFCLILLVFLERSILVGGLFLLLIGSITSYWRYFNQ